MSIFFSCPDAMTLVQSTSPEDGRTPVYEYADSPIPDLSLADANVFRIFARMGLPAVNTGEWAVADLPKIRGRLAQLVQGKSVDAHEMLQQLANRQIPLDDDSGYVANKAMQLLRIVDAAIANNYRVTWN